MSKSLPVVLLVVCSVVGGGTALRADATITAEILAWSRARGAFAGIALQGSTLREDSSENKELYGSELPNKSIVRENTAVPKGAEALMAALGKI